MHLVIKGVKINLFLYFLILIISLPEFSITSAIHFGFEDHCEFHLDAIDYEQIQNKLPEFENCATNVNRSQLFVHVSNSELPAFPPGTFSNLGHLTGLRVEVSNSTVYLLTPEFLGGLFFENSTFDEVVISLYDVTTLVGWKWSLLSQVDVSEEHGFEFNAVRSRLIHLSSDFSMVAKGRVTSVRILKCELQSMADDVFAPFSKLRSLELRENLLEQVQRSQFPDLGVDLKVLDLGKNRLLSLPEDIFEGMVGLQTLLLDGNNVHVTENQAKDLIRRNFPIIKSVLWPCECSVIRTLVEDYNKNTIKGAECYSENSKREVITKFYERC